MAGAHTWSQDSLADSLGGCNLSGRGLRAQRLEAKIATGFPCSEAPALEREGHDGRILLDKEVVVAEALDYANHVGGQAPQTVPSQATSRPFGPKGSMQMPMQDCQNTSANQRSRATGSLDNLSNHEVCWFAWPLFACKEVDGLLQEVNETLKRSRVGLHS